MEPVSAAVGLVAFGIKALDGLIDYYRSVKHAPENVQRTLNTAIGLLDSLKLLQSQLQTPTLNKDFVSRVEEDIEACHESFEELHETLEKIWKIGAEPEGLRNKLALIGKKAIYPFREGTLRLIREYCEDSNKALSISLNILQVYATPDRSRMLCFLIVANEHGQQYWHRNLRAA